MERTWGFFGNEWAVGLLQKHIIKGHVQHAYLIHGPDSIGKRTLATRFAKALLCPNTQDGNPCNICPTCAKADQGLGFDLKVINRIEGKTEIIIDQVREAEAFLRISPYAGTKKIVIYNDFDLANENTQNALLKTLEEAPKYAVIVLLCQRAQALLPTVLSRCEKMELRQVDQNEIMAFLRSKGASGEGLGLIAHIAGGCPGTAQRLAFDGAEILQERKDALSTFFSVFDMPLYERFSLADAIQIKDRKARESAKLRAKPVKGNKNNVVDATPEVEDALEEGLAERWLLYWLHLLGDLVKTSLNVDSGVTNIDVADDTSKLAAKLGPEQAQTAYQHVERAISQLRRNGNKRMVLEQLFISLPGL